MKSHYLHILSFILFANFYGAAIIENGHSSKISSISVVDDLIKQLLESQAKRNEVMEQKGSSIKSYRSSADMFELSSNKIKLANECASLIKEKLNSALKNQFDSKLIDLIGELAIDIDTIENEFIKANRHTENLNKKSEQIKAESGSNSNGHNADPIKGSGSPDYTTWKDASEKLKEDTKNSLKTGANLGNLLKSGSKRKSDNLDETTELTLQISNLYEQLKNETSTEIREMLLGCINALTEEKNLLEQALYKKTKRPVDIEIENLTKEKERIESKLIALTREVINNLSGKIETSKIFDIINIIQEDKNEKMLKINAKLEILRSLL